MGKIMGVVYYAVILAKE